MTLKTNPPQLDADVHVPPSSRPQRPNLQRERDHFEGLNERQREAVAITEGALLIVAGPGSGKTRVITHRIAHIVDDLKVDPYRVLAMTFTNKAAREMQNRLEQMVGPRARTGITVSTFHRFGARLLRMHGSAISQDTSFTIFDDTDQLQIIKRVFADLSIDKDEYSHRMMLSQISGKKSYLLTPEGASLNAQSYFDEIVARVYERYQDLLVQNNGLDFDDLLMKSYETLRDSPEVAALYQERFIYTMIDEFQDTNTAQYLISRQISAKHKNICVVGDPDQTIYTWRNARIGNILEFHSDHQDAKVIRLEQNYRSTGNILKAAHSLIENNQQRIAHDLWTSNPEGPKIVSGALTDGMEEGQFIISEVLDMTDPEGNAEYKLSDIAVMYRTNAQSRPVEEACIQYGILYQLIGGQKFYQRKEVKDILAYMRLVINPQDDVSFGRIVNSPPRGIGQKTVDEIASVASANSTSMSEAANLIGSNGSPYLAGRAVKAIQKFCVIMAILDNARDGRSLSQYISWIIDQTGYRDWLKNKDDQTGEDRLDNLDELIDAAGLHRPREDEDSDPIAEFLEQVSLVADIDSHDETKDMLTLITLHQAKGLEFPVVFIVGVNEGLLPHSRSLESEEQMEEERRLCYVGITRAEKRLYMLYSKDGYGRYKYLLNGASRFLGEIPTDTLTTEPYLNQQP